MNINLKKISVSLLASAFLFSVIEMQNVSAFFNDEKEIVLDSNGDETNTTIDEINAIIDLQNEAFVEENFSSVKEYENQLNSLGVQTVTGSELAKIIGEDQVGGIAKVKGATMKTVYSKYTTGGKTYDVMRVLATPTTSSNLYKTGVTALKSNTSAQAKTAHRTATYTSTFTPAYYDSTSKAYAGYKGSTYISQRIKSVNITGVSGKTVKNVVLTCPYNTTMVN